MTSENVIPLPVPLPPNDPRSDYYELVQHEKNLEWPRDRFQWKSKDIFPGDVHLNYMVDSMEDHLVGDIDWDIAVWWNTDIADAVRRFADHPPVKGRSIQQALGHAMPEEMDYDTALGLIGRIPRTDKRALDHIERAISHVVRSVDSIATKPFRVYDPARGVWVQEGDWFSSQGITVIGHVDDLIERFAMAMNRAVDLFIAIADQLAPMPIKPANNAGQPAKDDYARDLATRRRLTDPLDDVKKLADAIFNGKFRVLREDLRKRLAINEEKWDDEPRWLTLRDGVVDLQDVFHTGEINLMPFSPLRYTTQALDLAWRHQVRNAGQSEWDRGVAKILPDAEVRRYLQQRYGAALLGTPGAAGKSMVWQYGPGDTAKSTLQECIAGDRGVFAPYSMVASSQALTRHGQRGGAGELLMAQARGKRFIIFSELPDGEMLDGEIVKRVTGGETVSGTAKYANPISYYFTATLFMSSNHPPSFPAGDTALAARIHVVPFKHRFWVQSKNPKEWEAARPEDRADENWATRVLESPLERSAILRWVLDGLAAFGRDGGLGDLPEAMKEEREEFVSDADPTATLVRSLLGEETGWEDQPWIEILTDTEWIARGLRDGDGVMKPHLEAMITARAKQLGYCDQFGEVGSNFVLSARRMLNERGGTWKRVAVPGSQKKEWAMARMALVTSVVPA